MRDRKEYHRKRYHDLKAKRTPEEHEAFLEDNRRRGKLYRERNKEILKEKNRWNHLRRYGITKEEYDRMYEMQDGDCLICGEREGTCVDHNHETGEVRGLLCSQCNTAIGQLKDNPDIMRAAADYVERT